MRINKKPIMIAAVTLIIFTILPLYAQKMIPEEFLRAFSTQGFDIMDLLNKIAMIGLAMAILILLKGFAEKTSAAYLALSIVSTIFWLLIIFFALGLGKIENLGLAIISSQAGGASNAVIFDLRLFAYLAIVIAGLKIALSILKFREAKTKVTQVQPSSLLTPSTQKK